MNLLGTIVMYVGMIMGAAGLISAAKPVKFLRIETRSMGWAVAGVGFAFFAIGGALPAPLARSNTQTALDQWMPEWQFSEFHEKRVHASPEQVYAAIQQVTANEIFLFRTLTWIRNPLGPVSSEENILNAPGDKPILQVAQQSGFRLLAEDAPREVVLGTRVVHDGVTSAKDAAGLRALLTKPGNALAAINFRVQDEGNGWCHVTTETRVFATSRGARLRFALYWRVIYPGSSLLRYTWLNAIARRAERDP